MKRRNRYNNRKKEKIIMLMSSVFVLTALTVTGVYVKEKSEKQNNDGYIVDLSEMGGHTEEKVEEIADQAEANDLDYDPNFTEANSGEVENPSIALAGVEVPAEEEANAQAEDLAAKAEPAEEAALPEPEAEQVEAKVAQAVSFSERDTLQWPISGNILLNYSMDKTIFFPTLQQYKYNPAIIIQANAGENIAAAAAGTVERIYTDPEIGQAIVMNLGDGYELTYGQLQEIGVREGEYIDAGELLGTVAEPTKYYTVEGSNVYFKLTKNGVPVNPMSRLG